MMANFKNMLFVTLLGVTTMGYAGGCVVDGMNIWQLSQCIACSVGAYIELMQDDFTDGLTISAPGHYKLCQNITGAPNITIDASDVIFDGGSYSIAGAAITISAGQSDVIIRNMTISNTAAGILINANTQNILIENLVFDTIAAGDIPFAIDAAAGPMTGLTIRDVTIYNGSTENITVNGAASPNNFTNVVLENITCVNTNPDAVTDFGQIIYVGFCTDLTLRNIELVNQLNSGDAIYLTSCQDVVVDGLVVNSTLGVPASGTPAAYNIAGCANIISKNVVLNANGTAYAYGIFVDDASTNIIFDTCTVSRFVDSGFFISGGGSQFIDCNADYNEIGFLCAGAGSVFDNCSAQFNSSIGFTITGNSSVLESCIAQNSVIGFTVNVGNSCHLNNCIANSNSQNGIQVENVGAEALFIGPGDPQDGTWNIGQISPVMLGTTTSHNVKVTNCVAVNNGNGNADGIVMVGMVYDTAHAEPAITFIAPIFPPIGVLNTIQGIVYPSVLPIGETIIGASTGLVGIIANVLGGNLINNSPTIPE